MSAQCRRKLIGVVLAAGMLAVASGAQEKSGHGGAGEPGGRPGGQSVTGTITAVDAGGFTVKTDAGEAWKVTVGPNTRVTHDRKPAKVADLKVGCRVTAVGQTDASTPNTLLAAFTGYETADEVKMHTESFGKVWIAGQVIAVEGTKITITAQIPWLVGPSNRTFAVDQGTVYEKGGKDVKLTEVKPGDYVVGVRDTRPGTYFPQPGDYILDRNGLRSGPFVPTLLTITGP